MTDRNYQSKPWSISTTVRNPERLRNFLSVLKQLEGKPFSPENQIEYQILLIKNKLYIPLNIPFKYIEYFKKPDMEIPYKTAKEIFFLQNYTDPAMRGRQSANPLNKLGFCIARNNIGKIKITDLGNLFLHKNYDIGYIFFKSLLKLQFPNPWSKNFTKKYGFNVIPLIATMHLLNEINKISATKGLSQSEFNLFISTLINYELIDIYVKKIIEYRKSKKRDEFKWEFAKKFYKIDTLTNKHINNFDEYGDNIMRYFKLTRYFRFKKSPSGYGWRIDLENTRKIEINQILNQYTGEAFEFNSIDEYLKYISDISLPKLPSEEAKNLIQINKSLSLNILKFSKENNLTLSKKDYVKVKSNMSKLNVRQLNNLHSDLRKIYLTLKKRKKKLYLKYNINEATSILEKLDNLKKFKKTDPEEFEKFISDIFKIINDEIDIKPNYPVDDEGEPISHAPGNKSDIECFYNSFNAICEVTLDSSNYQWIRETQPVMRHLKEFNKLYQDKNNYCIFIAPKIHNDTLGQFWFSIKSGYDGKKQKIIPLSVETFGKIIRIIIKKISENKPPKHTDLKLLYDKILDKSNFINSYSEWFLSIDDIVNKWAKEVVYK